MTMRLDVFLVRCRNIPSRTKAQRMIESGCIQVNGFKILSASHEVSISDRVEIQNEKEYIPGKGYIKIRDFVRSSGFDFTGKVVLDAGASYGGFSYGALEMGAIKIYAVDIGHHQMASFLLNDPRMEVYENTDIRNFIKHPLNPLPDVVMADLSFISSTKILPCFYASPFRHADFIYLLKPQFELDRKVRMKKGIITDSQKRDQILHQRLEEWKKNWDTKILGIYPTNPPENERKNVEFIIWFRF